MQLELKGPIATRSTLFSAQAKYACWSLDRFSTSKAAMQSWFTKFASILMQDLLLSNGDEPVL
jgi:hypothetical protein